ncbi:ATP-dependent DNA helicase RecQ [Bdellovibrio sp. KM01]|uniref:RecQ family ATP-dependent DNA helicase n=1 Tax=Bdellovibrio sp. KM01 TaxID=2748865 RepID=UPI0015E9BA31|nr:ATP-dependent DNA helicase RecQ [Bdellovibrio sp. KM01]QLY24619.1 ATP-dependent DNA helicase RecQ [Bdellovibrio sp. KM01]
MMDLHDLLIRNFEFSTFRGEQEAILGRVWQGENLLALMPTGMGKSLCFQFPAKIREGLVIVISPLIALMQDQVFKAKDLGISATCLNSALTRDERESRQERLAKGDYKLLYVTPERFRKPEFLKAIEGRKIQLLAVDEAHCISQWGHDFRPDYSRVGEFRALLGNPPTLALTATATPEVQKDILTKLNIPDAEIISAGIERPNLALRVHDLYGMDDKIRAIVGLRYQQPGSGIVYCSLIQTLRKISAELNRAGVQHLVYHGDLSPQDRKRNQKAFINEEAPLMLATPAFGLGIDKPNVRLLVHAEIPSALESYFQEVGRAGRDGQESFCHLLYDQDDVSIQMEFLKWSHPEPEFIAKIYDLIEQNRLRVNQEKFDFLREQMNFRNRRDFRPEAAVSILERWGCLQKSDDPFPYLCVQAPTAEQFAAENGPVILKAQNSKLLEMVRWATQDKECRMNYIYHYFGHKHETPCGKCDICVDNQK